MFSVGGYKAIRETRSVRVAPITVLAGVNSSGKSSFMQPFLMMKQTLDSAFDPGPLLIHGPNVKNSSHTEIFSRGKARLDSVQEFTASVQIGGRRREITFGTGPSGLAVANDRIETEEFDLSLSEPLSSKTRKKMRKALDKFAAPYTQSLREDSPVSEYDFDIYRNRCFLEPVLQLSLGGAEYRLPIGEDAFGNSMFVELLRGIIHVPGLRGNPERTYSRSAVGRTYPGTFETYVASIVYEWGESDPSRLAALANDLEMLGLTWKVRARRLNDASIELQVGRMPHPQQGGANDLVNVVDVGFGVSQTLPVLVALHAARPGQLVYVEQPEIHLHPRAQFGLAHAFSAAARRGVAVVIETHSSLLIRGLQVAVAEGRITQSDLSLNWFSRDPISGFQEIEVATLDASGRFGDWPIDFDDVTRAADWKYLDAISGVT